MKKKKSLLTKRVYFAITVLTLLIAAGIMTSAANPPNGAPKHGVLYTNSILSNGGATVYVNDSLEAVSGIKAKGVLSAVEASVTEPVGGVAIKGTSPAGPTGELGLRYNGVRGVASSGAGVKGEGSTGVEASGTSYGVYSTTTSGTAGVEGRRGTNYGQLGTATEGVYGKSSTGNEGRLGYGAYGVYTPNALYASSISTGALSATSVSTSSLSLSGGMSAQSFTTTGGAATGVYGQGTSYGIQAQGGYYGVLASGSGMGIEGDGYYGVVGVSTGGGYGVYSLSGGIRSDGGYNANGVQGVSGSFVFTDTSGTKRTITVSNGIVTYFG